MVTVLCLLVLASFVFPSASGDHVRGGYLAWWPTGESGQIRFTYEVIVRREGENTKCNEFNLGVFSVDGSTDIVASGPGLMDNTVIGRNSYVCTGFSREEGVVQGEGSFLYTFPDPRGLYTVRLDECCLPSYADNSEFTLMTVVDLRLRNDTGVANSPPVSSVPPLVYVNQGCSSELRLLVADNDGDDIRCRLSVGEECGTTGCVPFPTWAVLGEACSVTFTDPQPGSAYLSITVEDFPPGVDTPLTAIPIRLTVNVASTNSSCTSKPTFDSNVTPPERSCDTVQAGGSFTAYILTTPSEGRSISELLISGPARLSVERRDQTGGSVLFVVQWTPSIDQYGTHVISYLAIDNTHQSSDVRFLTLYAGTTQVAVETGSNLPNTLVAPDNRLFNISFNQNVQLSSIRRLIYIEQLSPQQSTLEVIDVSSSQQVMTSGNTLFIRITAELMLGATYRVNIESGAVVPLLSCPQQPGQTGLVLSADFEWTFTAGYGPCYRNCTKECLPEEWERNLCSFYNDLRQWSALATSYGLRVPSIDPQNAGTPNEQWEEARVLWEEINEIWRQEAITRGFVLPSGGVSTPTPSGSPLNEQWVLSSSPWHAGQQFWESTVGVSLGDLPETRRDIQTNEWAELLANWTAGAEAYSFMYNQSP